MKLLFALSLITTASASFTYFNGHREVIQQRLVHVIEIGPDHLPKYYDLLEDVTR